MALIPPRLIVTSGSSGTGKSTVLRKLVKWMSNSFILEKDSINQGMMHVAKTDDQRLLPFSDYVARDSVFGDNAREVETALGTMIQVDPKNAFYGRHGRDQAYLVMERLARTNLEAGKIPIIDCATIKQIEDGTLAKFMEQPVFAPWPRYLVHFVTTDENEHYQRHVERAARDPAAAIRDKDKISSREAFHEFVTVKQPMLPEGLSRYKHLLIDNSSSKGTPEQHARTIFDYVSQR